MKQIILETEHVILRFFAVEDADKIFRMSREEGMRLWIPGQVYHDEAQAGGVVRFLCEQYAHEPDPQNAPYVLGVELKDDRELIGHVGLSATGDDVEIGYAIEEKHQGKGFATEAVRGMTDWALAELKLPCVLGIVASENKASVRVLEKAGYRFVEEKKKHAFGRYCLCRIYRKDP